MCKFKLTVTQDDFSVFGKSILSLWDDIHNKYISDICIEAIKNHLKSIDDKNGQYLYEKIMESQTEDELLQKVMYIKECFTDDSNSDRQNAMKQFFIDNATIAIEDKWEEAICTLPFSISINLFREIDITKTPYYGGRIHPLTEKELAKAFSCITGTIDDEFERSAKENGELYKMYNSCLHCEYMDGNKVYLKANWEIKEDNLSEKTVQSVCREIEIFHKMTF